MRKICVVTGTRAEYGLLYWLMKEIQADPGLQLQLVVTGMHLSPEFGLTYRAIEADGFTESERAEAVADIEKSTTELNLSIAGRIRMRCDAIDLLEGRLEIGDFVARCVARQECYAAVQREVLSYQNTESIKV